MTKFKELPFYKQVTLVYVYSFICSLPLSPLFGKLFIIIFNPSMHGGLFPSPEDRFALIGGTLFGFLFFVSFLSAYFLTKNVCKVWFFGFIFPFLMIVSNVKEIFLALLLSVIGWCLARLVLFVRNSKNK